MVRPKMSHYLRHLKHYPTEAKTLGDFLRQKRVDAGLSQRQLAEILGFTDTAIEKWEKNINRPTEPHRARIIQFLGFDPGLHG